MCLVTTPLNRNMIVFDHVSKLPFLGAEALPRWPPRSSQFQGKFPTTRFMPVFQHAVSLRKPYDGGSEAIERPPFFTESHQRELPTLAPWQRHAEAAKVGASKSWPAGSLCSTGATGLIEPIPTVQTRNIICKLLTGGKKPQRHVYVVSHNNKYLRFRMFRVKHSQAEWETLFISYAFQTPKWLQSLDDD